MEKGKLKKIGAIAIGVLTLLSTSLSIAAIVSVKKRPHMPPCPPAHMQEHQDGPGPRGGNGPQGSGRGTEMDHGNGPHGPEDDGKPGDERDHCLPRKDENKKGEKPQGTGQNPEEKKEQTKEIH